VLGSLRKRTTLWTKHNVDIRLLRRSGSMVGLSPVYIRFLAG
jgi:hypothetical protein